MDKDELQQIINAITNVKSTNDQEVLNRQFITQLTELKSAQKNMSIQIQSVDQKIDGMIKTMQTKVKQRISVTIPIVSSLILAASAFLLHFF